MPHVKVDDLTKNFGGVIAVDHVNLGFADEQLTTVLGPSGCGKTTLLRCIAGLERPDFGEIIIGKEKVASTADGICFPPEKRNLGMVFQSYAVWPHMTVFDNVAYPLRVRKLSKTKISERVREVLSTVRLTGLEKRYATQLSGGQQQRVALARALVYEPKVLLLDEPLSNLDAKLREEMRVEIKDLQERLKITTIYVTHDQIEAISISDAIAVMNAGRVLEVGTPKEIYEHAKHKFVADFMGMSNLIPGKVSEELDRVDTIIGALQCHIPRSVKTGNEVLVSIRPRNIEVTKKTPKNKTNVWKGKVKTVRFVGEYLDCTIEIEELTIKAHVSPLLDVKVDEKCFIALHPDNCVITRE